MPSYKQSALLKQLYLHLVGLGRCRYGACHHLSLLAHTRRHGGAWSLTVRARWCVCCTVSHVGEEEHTKLVQKGTPPRNYGSAGVGVYYSSDDDDDYWER